MTDTLAQQQSRGISLFRDRRDAGRRLGRELVSRGVRVSVVCGLLPGGVLVAAEVADVLAVPLDVIVVRKLGLPARPKMAMGAIGEDWVRLIDAALLRRAGATFGDFAAAERREREVLDRWVEAVRGDHRPRDLIGQTVLIVDDGITSWVTMSAASLVARKRGAAQVIVAAPVASLMAVPRITGAAQVVCLEQRPYVQAVSACYRDFPQTTASQVYGLLGDRPELTAS
ncbi:phosphoribosyltransferase [Ruania albidiflava]|uniref:phosphoribosyltransferase n=1 Tax=Ruania albidiflava TaxID=366586 RepID=UPI0023F02B06|nr:phosphoribosyltransferase family protein [Ruania albidiflava]